jgi:hypothetical protein
MPANIHKRAVPTGQLLDTLSDPDDRLWPHHAWPRMRFDRPLAVGAVGGHGPIRYTVSHYVPGRWVRFAFTGPRGFDGFHEYAVQERDGRTVLRHTLAMRVRGLARLGWPLLYRPLHDALIEDSLDRAEFPVEDTRDRAESPDRPARWSWYVRLLRWAVRSRPAR